MTVYKSKVGLEIVIPIGVIIAVTLIMALNNLWLMFIFLVLSISLLYISTLSISYLITDNRELIVKWGFFKRTIKISRITKIVETNNLISSPAASRDRIEIKYGIGAVIISPKDKSSFINHLLDINPAIEVKLKPNSMVKLSH